jgi:hypothetical protein
MDNDAINILLFMAKRSEDKRKCAGKKYRKKEH